MNRPSQIRKVYAELRSSLGESVSAREVLEAAASLVELFTTDEEEAGPSFSLRSGGVPFYQWAVDVALADGGWRVYGYELEQAQCIEDQEEKELFIHRGFKRFAEGAYA